MIPLQNSLLLKSLLLTFLFLFTSAIIRGQENKTKIVIPGGEYNAGAVHRFFFGDHWRDLWTTPIEVP